ncbi:hypothetical protein GIB67_014053 [Kingdonia uniflora]|uniref:Uncharacterized protein n=1 Tax=Kingdonia uniflora TaxID=39325 RepID=A0A7J7KXK1_9MAGN|nr:hypothetical protein GIB67_014053 [Kingdonia uniflora]
MSEVILFLGECAATCDHDVSSGYGKEGIMRTRRASRMRLVDEEDEVNKPSVSGRGQRGESSDMEVLEITMDAPLAVVVPGVVPSTRSRRRAQIVGESDEEENEEGDGKGDEGNVEPSGNEMEEGEEGQSDNRDESNDSGTTAGTVSSQEMARLDRFIAKHGLSKVGVILVPVGVEYSFKDTPQDGIMAFRG